jgi:UDP-N-acetylglucosamine 2-epimerase
MSDPAAYATRAALRNPYGDGNASRRIVEVLERDIP